MQTTFAQNLLAFFSAAMGAALAISFGVSHRQLCAFISFAAGTLFSVTLFHILPEAWGVLSPGVVLVALFSGYLLFYWISRYVFHVCPACAASHFEHQVPSQLNSFIVLLVIALSIHSTMDGMAIAIGGELASQTRHSIFSSVTIHKSPEGLALCALLLKAGYQKWKALVTTILLETSTLIGWAIGFYFVQKGYQQWIQLLLAHIGGGFVYLALHAVLNEAKEHSPRFVILFFLGGVILIALTH